MKREKVEDKEKGLEIAEVALTSLEMGLCGCFATFS